MTIHQDPYHAPNGNKWPRWTITTLLSALLGAGLHTLVVFIMGEDARILPAPMLAGGFILMGIGCTLLSELMRLHPDWTKQTRRADVMRHAFIWSLLTPFSFTGFVPVPLIAMAGVALLNAAFITFFVAVVISGLFVWLHWIGVDLSRRHFKNKTIQWISEGVLWAGMAGAIILIGGPVLPDLVLI